MIYCTADQQDDTVVWVLSLYREATDDDLEQNHHLEQVGDLIWNTRVEIRHCPFCGAPLAQAEIPAQPSAPTHYDSSGWSTTES